MTHTRNCAQCGIIFEAARAHAKYHNDACRAAGRRDLANTSGRTAYQMVRSELRTPVVMPRGLTRARCLADTPEIPASRMDAGDQLTGGAAASSYGTRTMGIGGEV